MFHLLFVHHVHILTNMHLKKKKDNSSKIKFRKQHLEDNTLSFLEIFTLSDKALSEMHTLVPPRAITRVSPRIALLRHCSPSVVENRIRSHSNHTESKRTRTDRQTETQTHEQGKPKGEGGTRREIKLAALVISAGDNGQDQASRIRYVGAAGTCAASPVRSVDMAQRVLKYLSDPRRCLLPVEEWTQKVPTAKVWVENDEAWLNVCRSAAQRALFSFIAEQDVFRVLGTPETHAWKREQRVEIGSPSHSDQLMPSGSRRGHPVVAVFHAGGRKCESRMSGDGRFLHFRMEPEWIMCQATGCPVPYTLASKFCQELPQGEIIRQQWRVHSKTVMREPHETALLHKVRDAWRGPEAGKQ